MDVNEKRRRGRPRLNPDRALSAAERVRRHRAKLKAAQQEDHPDDPFCNVRMELDIKDLRRELARDVAGKRAFGPQRLAECIAMAYGLEACEATYACLRQRIQGYYLQRQVYGLSTPTTPATPAPSGSPPSPGQA